DHGAHLGTTGLHGAQLLERRLRVLGEHPRERRLARPRRPVEDHRVRPALLDRRAQGRALGEQVALPDELLERVRSHANGQRAPGLVGALNLARRARGAGLRARARPPGAARRFGRRSVAGAALALWAEVEQLVLHPLSIARWSAHSNNNRSKWEEG